MTASRASGLLATIAGCLLSLGAARAQMDEPPPVRVLSRDPADGVGLIDNARSGLPASLWRGVSIANARLLILDLPSAPQSRVLRDLQFRLLTTNAVSPRADGSTGANLLTLRVERLAAMAEAESANELLRRADGGEDAATARLVTESLLRVAQRASACARVKDAGERYSDVWWREAAIVCHIHAREAVAARGKLDALRNERGFDPAFVALATRALGGAAATAPDAVAEHGLTLALLDLAGLPVPVADGDSPGLQRAVIENKAVPLERRVQIAERAERSGVIEPDRLADVYSELARGIKDGAATSPTAGRARVFAEARGATGNEQLVAIAQRLYAVSPDTAGSAIRSLSSAIAAARPTPDHAELATAGFLAALTLERFDLAKEWFTAARGGAEAAASDRIALLAPLAALARLPDRPPLEQKMMERRAALRPQSAAALHAVLTALGAGHSENLAPLVPKPSRTPPDSASVALLAAAEAGHVGETICRLAALAGVTPVARLEPDKVSTILRALLQINLRDVARSFALEYALLAGL